MTRISRRNWMCTVLAAGTAATGPCLAIADEKRPEIELGFSLYGFPKTPVLNAITTVAEIGYQSVELALLPNWPTDPATFTPQARKDVARAIADHGLRLPALMDNLPLSVDDATFAAHTERVRRAAEVGHELCTTGSPLLETVLGGKPGTWDDVRDSFAGRLSEWARLAESLKLTIAVKAHVGNAMNRPEHLTWLLDKVNSPRIRGAFDQSHFDGRGIALADAWQKLSARTVFIHVKDRAPGEAVRFLLPGEGTIDYAELFRLLRRDRYLGPVMVEVSGQIHSRPDYDAEAAARKSYIALNASRKAVLAP